MKQSLQIQFYILVILAVNLLAVNTAMAAVVDFEVKNEEKKVRISVHGLVKENIKFITLQRCASGTSFADLEQISSDEIEEAGKYTFMDNSPFYGNNFYRVRIEDANGDVRFSDIKYARNLEISSKITLFPNPSNGNPVYLKLDACKVPGYVKITVYSKLGVKVKEHTIDNNSGMIGPIRLDVLSDLHPDIYHIHIESNEFIFREQLVINAGK